MKCEICKQGETGSGMATVTLERGDMVLVFRRVPAEVCGVCGEEYVDELTPSRSLEIAEDAADNGVQMDVREYVAA